jgi:hypothetical protein
VDTFVLRRGRVTAAGARRPVVLPSPSCRSVLLPHAMTEPSASRARLGYPIALVDGEDVSPEQVADTSGDV